jgi:hypothetical protein
VNPKLQADDAVQGAISGRFCCIRQVCWISENQPPHRDRYLQKARSILNKPVNSTQALLNTVHCKQAPWYS